MIPFEIDYIIKSDFAMINCELSANDKKKIFKIILFYL